LPRATLATGGVNGRFRKRESGAASVANFTKKAAGKRGATRMAKLFGIHAGVLSLFS
jgi:hypothetical protein